MDEILKILLVGSDFKTNRAILKTIKLDTDWQEAPIDQMDNLDSAKLELTIMGYSLVLVDCESLKSSPLETLIQLRGINKRIPIILLNTPGMEKTAISCLRNGADYYLIKDQHWLEDLTDIMSSVFHAYEIREKMKKKMVQLENDNKELSKKAITDQTTQLYSAEYFKTLLSRELKRATRYGQHLACLIIDLNNHTKEENTDEKNLYEKLGLLIKSIVRSCDIWARIDNNQFAALLPNTDAKHARIAMKRIESEIEETFDESYHPIKFKWGLANFDKSKISQEDDFLAMAMASLK